MSTVPTVAAVMTVYGQLRYRAKAVAVAVLPLLGLLANALADNPDATKWIVLITGLVTLVAVERIPNASVPVSTVGAHAATESMRPATEYPKLNHA